MKRCFKCGLALALDEFYRHPDMADGLLGKCKRCTRADVSSNYRKRKPQYASYEMRRSASPSRKAAKAEYQKRHRAKHPEKNRARQRVAYALRAGLLQRQPCERCGSVKSQAHHPDHSRPLDVQWLCVVHHREAERQER